MDKMNDKEKTEDKMNMKVIKGWICLSQSLLMIKIILYQSNEKQGMFIIYPHFLILESNHLYNRCNRSGA